MQLNAGEFTEALVRVALIKYSKVCVRARLCKVGCVSGCSFACMCV